MKALAIVEKGRLGIIEIPVPQIGEYDALCKMEACAFCNSTDHKLIENEFCPGVFPSVIGHEVIGTVVKVGGGVKNYAVGDRVFRQTLTDAMVPGGRSNWGGFSEYGVITDQWAKQGVSCDAKQHPFPQQRLLLDVPAPEATAMVTLMECLDCVTQCGVAGKKVAVMGSGPVAQAMALFATLLGATKVVAVGRREIHRARFAAVCQKAEYVTSPEGIGAFDLVLEAVGSAEALASAVSLAKEDGQVKVYGIAAASVPHPANLLADRRVECVGATEGRVQQELVDTVRSGAVRLRDWYDVVLPLSEYQKAYDLVRLGNAYKAVLTPYR
ncbi:MAG: alcohol dehydrogenase catalytic domain-containing protein [Kiritimatiellaeota bacterium]|nr:alcohol dehydrogenase catalytic domain-containing protein [Kiritimatiellota bacterium]